MSSRRYTVGLSWGDVESAGRVAFPYVHTAGAGVLSAFGAGALVAPITSLEQRGGLLPATSSIQHADRVVQKPDYMILVPNDGSKQPVVVQQPDLVGVYNGRRFDGNGYTSAADLGKKFSFGYDAPTSVDVSVKGKQVTVSDVKQVLFCGGVETKNGPTNIAGEVMSNKGRGIVSTILGALGFDDDDEDDLIGAASQKFVQIAAARATPHSGFVFRQTPKKGRKFTSLAVNRNAKYNPKKTSATAHVVAQRAQAIAARVDATTKVANKPGSKVTIVGASNARSFGTRAPRRTIAQLKAMGAKLATAGKAMGAKADKYDTTLVTAANKRIATTKQAQTITKIHGMGITDVLGWSPTNYFTDILGALAADAVAEQDLLGDGPPVPDPTRPGYLTDGNPDPGYGGSTSDPSAGATTSSLPGAPDYGAGAPPSMDSVQPQPYIDFQPDPGPSTDTAFYDCPTDADLPLGAIVFDGSHQPGYLTLGNMSCFYGMVPGLPAPKGGPYSGYQLHDDGWWLLLQGTQPSTGYSGGKNYDQVSIPSSAMVAESQRNNWGPLVGAPTIPGTQTPSFTAGLRFSASGPSGPRWFWFWDQAPDWAKQPILQARMNDAIVAYQAAVTAGQADYVNAALQDQLDAATAAQQTRDQAKQDAALALQQQAADQSDTIAQQQQQQAQAQLDLQAQQAEMAYAQQHPDQYFGPQAQQPQGGGFDAGGGGLTSDGYGSFSDTGDGTAIDWDSQTTSRDNSELAPLESGGDLQDDYDE